MKKTLIIIFISLLFVQLGKAQFELEAAYNYARPQGDMAVNIQRSHGISFAGLYHIPNAPFVLGMELGFSGYGHEKTRQIYTFTDGSQTETDVHVNNNILNVNLVMQVEFLRQAAVTPFIQAKTGISRFYTNLRIDDPQDIDDCHPLEQDNLLSSTAFIASAGAGFKMDLATFFPRMEKRRFYFNAQSNYLMGTKVKYMSVRAPKPEMNQVDDVNVEFINNQTQIIHKHHVGYVYQSDIRMMDFRFGLAMRF